jgi:hypothetical protein
MSLSFMRDAPINAKFFFLNPVTKFHLEAKRGPNSSMTFKKKDRRRVVVYDLVTGPPAREISLGVLRNPQYCIIQRECAVI